MRVLVCGGRGFENEQKLFADLDYWHARLRITLLVQGGQVTLDPSERDVPHSRRKRWGADFLAKKWAMSRAVPWVEESISDGEWKKLGRSAGPIRNGRMLKKHNPERVIAFPGGAGTADMIDQARRCGVKVIEVA